MAIIPIFSIVWDTLCRTGFADREAGLEGAHCDAFSFGTLWIHAVLEELISEGVPIDDYRWITPAANLDPLLRVAVDRGHRLLQFPAKDIESIPFSHTLRARLVVYITNKLTGEKELKLRTRYPEADYMERA
jgi:hypothetical protein